MCPRNTVYNGIYNDNPFQCEHFNISNIAVPIDGQLDIVPSRDPNSTKSLYLRCFHSMFEGAGKFNTDDDIIRISNRVRQGIHCIDLTWQRITIKYLRYPHEDVRA